MRNDLGRRARVAAGVVVVAAAACGCIGYRLGSTLPPGIRTVHVPTFINRSGEPLLESPATAATLEELQRDGTLSLAGQQDADALLEVTLTRFILEPLRYDRNDVKTTSEYRMRIAAELVFTERRTGKELSRRKVEGEATFDPLGDMTNAKRSVLPKATQDLAHHIVETVVEYWY